jgi:hypothetical protein
MKRLGRLDVVYFRDAFVCSFPAVQYVMAYTAGPLGCERPVDAIIRTEYMYQCSRDVGVTLPHFGLRP